MPPETSRTKSRAARLNTVTSGSVRRPAGADLDTGAVEDQQVDARVGPAARRPRTRPRPSRRRAASGARTRRAVQAPAGPRRPGRAAPRPAAPARGRRGRRPAPRYARGPRWRRTASTSAGVLIQQVEGGVHARHPVTIVRRQGTFRLPSFGVPLDWTLGAGCRARAVTGKAADDPREGTPRSRARRHRLRQLRRRPRRGRPGDRGTFRGAGLHSRAPGTSSTCSRWASVGCCGRPTSSSSGTRPARGGRCCAASSTPTGRPRSRPGALAITAPGLLRIAADGPDLDRVHPPVRQPEPRPAAGRRPDRRTRGRPT